LERADLWLATLPELSFAIRSALDAPPPKRLEDFEAVKSAVARLL
jgi:hypothetical protein